MKRCAPGPLATTGTGAAGNATPITRLPSVHRVLSVLFNEGYSSARADQVIRCELCEEAVRLMTLLAAHPVGEHPESFALLALAEFHVARLSERLDGQIAILLLEQQDHSLWQRDLIQRGLSYLNRSASGDLFSRYQAEQVLIRRRLTLCAQREAATFG